MTSLIIVGFLTISTGALFTTTMPRKRALVVVTCGILIAELALLATLIVSDSLDTEWWITGAVSLLALTNVILWLVSTVHSLGRAEGKH